VHAGTSSTTQATDTAGLPPGQHARKDFPRFGTHLHRRAPAIPVEPTIEVAGAVREPLFVSVESLAALPRREQDAQLHCVSGWSATGLLWAGVPFAEFYRLIVEPVVEGAPTHLVLEGLDGYRIVEALEDALREDVLLADRLDGEPLTSDHGAPVRFVSPSQYGYVSAKHLARIEVHTREPKENFSWVHPLGALIMRPPFFWRHPRGRVWHEERNRHLPAWLLRVVYAPLRPPIRFASGLGARPPRGSRRRDR
jgi:DMSO/TMAO reductase YedYZ molybdopterin-dependent catalytic subunit